LKYNLIMLTMLIIFASINILNEDNMFIFLGLIGIYMKNKIQEGRMKQYFIDAATEIIRGEGIQAVSVRTVAERAGYSYATLYNYFTDLNELLIICTQLFAEESKNYVTEGIKNLPQEKDSIEMRLEILSRYFVQYPGIFRLIFLENITNIGNDFELIKIADSIVDNILNDEQKIRIDLKLLKAVVYGSLLMYLNKRMPQSYTEFINEYRIKIRTIINLKK
jgi:AcrR family transcriptional regulator